MYLQVTKESRGAFWKDFMGEYFVEEATLVIEVEIGGKMEKFRTFKQFLKLSISLS